MRRPSDSLKLGAFVVSPFAGFIISLFDINSKISRIVIFGFFVLFGLTFIPQFEAADSFRYAQTFHNFAKNPDASFARIYNVYVNHEGVSGTMLVKDLWVYCMYYLSVIIGGDNVHVFFALVAVVFAFFCVKCLKYITSNQYFTRSIYMFILAFLFIYNNNIQNINGVRFWTVAWIAAFITFKAIIDKKIWYAVFLIPLPMMHGSFVIYWALFSGAYLLRRNLKFLTILFFVSLAFSEVGLSLSDAFKNSMPAFLQRMIYAYTESKIAVSRMDGSAYGYMAGYAKFFNALPRLFELLMVALVSFRHNKIKNKQVAGFMIAYFCCVNLLAVIPSMGRYYIVGWPMLIYVWVSEWPAMRRYKNMLLIAPFAYCYHIFLLIRFIIATSHWSIYVSNPFHIIYRNLFPS